MPIRTPVEEMTRVTDANEMSRGQAESERDRAYLLVLAG